MAEPLPFDPDRPLAGLGVLVSRPRERAVPILREIRAAGGEAWWLPGVEIAPPPDAQALAQALAALPEQDWAIFVSPTAVEQAWPAITRAHGGWPAAVRAAAVGRATARALARHGVPEVLAPPGQADSEALLALPQLQQLQARKVMIFRGVGGRTLLADTLAARGAQVSHAVCYRRVPPQGVDVERVLAAWRAGRIDLTLVYSRESLDGLMLLLDAEGQRLLQRTPMLVPHPRIAEHARALGVQSVEVMAAEAPLASTLIERMAHVRH
ncbi:MAG: uroporphyrinogen-III synthase [Thiobacillaceae bacterium]|nr:uroporphyrinogen-III synthase [Thiobacillaceae bacterium]MDW8323924.1 uroporphyrinogen-III synthase [Burkholderiales bacterium]